MPKAPCQKLVTHKKDQVIQDPMLQEFVVSCALESPTASQAPSLLSLSPYQERWTKLVKR